MTLRKAVVTKNTPFRDRNVTNGPFCGSFHLVPNSL
ncbi:hypothetical protein QFZ50_000055 [Arthrobacter agilis]|nr:hypothetical protein [Arthrobacter agilis]